jgi:hypothetical protein
MEGYMISDTKLVRCPRADCATWFSPATSSADCPHRWNGRATPLLDKLAARIRRGERVKFESWQPVNHPHTGEIDALSAP